MTDKKIKVDKIEVIVAVCTFNRNVELDNLLSKLKFYSESAWKSIKFGVTVIDDSSDGVARSVANNYLDAFALGIKYENTAARNISIARNRAIESSIQRADWMAMTDDDCEPSEQWLPELVKIQRHTSADVVTGLMLRRAPDHAPNWLKTQPFLELGEFEAKDGDELSVAFTNNSLVSCRLLRAGSLRFDPALGRIGGEDVTFFRLLKKQGAKLVFAEKAFVFENEPESRLTFRYQLRRHLWHGNSSVVTSLYNGHGRVRMMIHGLATIFRAFARPLKRILKGQPPQFAYFIALIFEGVGKILGVFGLKINHS